MKKAVYILCGVALAGLLLVGGCAGLFFYKKNQEENVMTELLNEKPTLLKYLGLIEEVNVDLGATDKRSPSGELMILSVKGSENSGTLTYGNITDGNQTVSLMELKLSDGTVIDLNGQLEILGWGTETTATPSDPIQKLIADPIVEKAVRESLEKPEGEITIADLQRLIWLILSETQITDEGLKEVAKLKKLEDLRLDETQITDAGLKEVAKLQQLKNLFLEGTQITDEGLKEVAKLQQLEWLDLWDTKITDAGLKEVAKLQKLEILWLDGTKVTDVGLKEVAKLQKLKNLSLDGPQITEAGMAELKKALPNCTILGP